VVTRTAGTLRRHGVRPGSAVHVALRNCPAFVALWLAAARLGAWIVPVDPTSSARDIRGQARLLSDRIEADGVVALPCEQAESGLSDLDPGLGLTPLIERDVLHRPTILTVLSLNVTLSICDTLGSGSNALEARSVNHPPDRSSDGPP
jgi:hypothetical protein